MSDVHWIQPHRFASGPFNPITGVGWAHAYWVEGTEFLALGLADTNNINSWPDEIGTDNLAVGSDNAPTYDASHASLNNQPAALPNAPSWVRGSFASTISQPFSVVFVGVHAGSTASYTPFDGSNATVPTTIYRSGTDIRMNAGSDADVGNTDANAHLFVCLFNGASSLMEKDGTATGTVDVGTNTLRGLTVFSNRETLGGDGAMQTGPIAFIAAYNGDVRNDGGWANFESWCEDHYGLTIA